MIKLAIIALIHLVLDKKQNCAQQQFSVPLSAKNEIISDSIDTPLTLFFSRLQRFFLLISFGFRVMHFFWPKFEKKNGVCALVLEMVT